MVTQVRFARSGFNSNAWNIQSIVRTVHTALGRLFFILLDGHNPLLVLGGCVGCSFWGDKDVRILYARSLGL